MVFLEWQKRTTKRKKNEKGQKKYFTQEETHMTNEQ